MAFFEIFDKKIREANLEKKIHESLKINWFVMKFIKFAIGPKWSLPSSPGIGLKLVWNDWWWGLLVCLIGRWCLTVILFFSPLFGVVNLKWIVSSKRKHDQTWGRRRCNKHHQSKIAHSCTLHTTSVMCLNWRQVTQASLTTIVNAVRRLAAEGGV